MDISITIDDAGWRNLSDAEGLVRRAIRAAAAAAGHDGQCDEVAVVLGSDAQVASLNSKWRGKSQPTNVLSFPAARPAAIPDGAILPLGDIILAYGVVAAEANSHSKAFSAHVSHLVIHGMLHLLGYDHLDDGDAGEMEAIEITAMKRIGLSNPYEELATIRDAV